MSKTDETLSVEGVVAKSVRALGVKTELKRMNEEALETKVISVEDKQGYAAAKAAKGRMVMARNDIERKRKELKQPYLDAGKHIDAAAKELTALIESGEAHLAAECKKVEDHEAEVKRKKEEARAAAIAARKQVVLAFKPVVSGLGYQVGGVVITDREIEAMPDSDFSAKSKLMESERKRLDEEQERMAAHMARLKELEAKEAQREAEAKKTAEQVPDAVETGFDPFGPDLAKGMAAPKAAKEPEPVQSLSGMGLGELVAEVGRYTWINVQGVSLTDTAIWKEIVSRC
jgi:hypothetical protein